MVVALWRARPEGAVAAEAEKAFHPASQLGEHGYCHTHTL